MLSYFALFGEVFQHMVNANFKVLFEEGLVNHHVWCKDLRTALSLAILRPVSFDMARKETTYRQLSLLMEALFELAFVQEIPVIHKGLKKRV